MWAVDGICHAAVFCRTRSMQEQEQSHMDFATIHELPFSSGLIVQNGCLSSSREWKQPVEQMQTQSTTATPTVATTDANSTATSAQKTIETEQPHKPDDPSRFPSPSPQTTTIPSTVVTSNADSPTSSAQKTEETPRHSTAWRKRLVLFVLVWLSCTVGLWLIYLSLLCILSLPGRLWTWLFSCLFKSVDVDVDSPRMLMQHIESMDALPALSVEHLDAAAIQRQNNQMYAGAMLVWILCLGMLSQCIGQALRAFEYLRGHCRRHRNWSQSIRLQSTPLPFAQTDAQQLFLSPNGRCLLAVTPQGELLRCHWETAVQDLEMICESASLWHPYGGAKRLQPEDAMRRLRDLSRHEARLHVDTDGVMTMNRGLLRAWHIPLLQDHDRAQTWITRVLHWALQQHNTHLTWTDQGTFVVEQRNVLSRWFSNVTLVTLPVFAAMEAV